MKVIIEEGDMSVHAEHGQNAVLNIILIIYCKIFVNQNQCELFVNQNQCEVL